MGTEAVMIPGEGGEPDLLVEAGINYNAIESVEVLLGIGNDRFTITGTAFGAITAVHGGGNSLVDRNDIDSGIGRDEIYVSGGGGEASPLLVFGDTAQDGSRYSSNAEEANGNAMAFVNSGDDLIDARASSNGLTIFGGLGNDTIHGSQAGDHIAGGSGNDTLHGEGGEDHIYGDSGVNADVSTRLSMTGQIVSIVVVPDLANDSLNSDPLTPGMDFIFGGGDSDIIFGDHGLIVMPATILRATTTAGVERIETLVEDTGVGDEISGNGGDDFILGGLGGDLLLGNEGKDILIGDHGSIDFHLDGNPDSIDQVMSRNVLDGAPDTIHGGEENDIILGGNGGDELHGDNNQDILLGDYGRLDFVEGQLTQLISTDVTKGAADTIYGGKGDDVIIGGLGADKLNGGDDDDLILGDYALVEVKPGGVFDLTTLPGPGLSFTFTSIETGRYAQDPPSGDAGLPIGGADLIHGDRGNDILIGQQGGDTVYGDAGDDDIIGGHNVAHGFDTGDFLDGGSGDDVIAGDNAVIMRRLDVRDERHRVLAGEVIYAVNSDPDINGRSQHGSQYQLVPTGRATRDITLLNHSDVESMDHYGADRIAGGADDDVIFGQLGDDFLQGDGSISIQVDAERMPDGNLDVTASVEAVADGDDYIEGNGGNDIIFGNLGQDDLVGGSSSLFGGLIGDERLRPDGQDLIFGGAGTDIDRNHAGDLVANGHARDADVIAGDNANIYRLVGAGQYLSFNYDFLDPARQLADPSGLDFSDQWIVPRAVQLLDYTQGGPDYDLAALGDNGAADEIHGEAGDDFIYGQVGKDILFGDGQDDDLIGGWGHDWISGGMGDDGILGDDGRLWTSRNGTGEPLYGIPVTADLDLQISTAGNVQQAIINVSGKLKKTAVLSPFNLGPDDLDPLFDPSYADDILFGGLGNDAVHGGAGDDAISGTEALPVYFDIPLNGGNTLGYSQDRAGEFNAYNEYNPLAKVFVDSATGIFIEASAPGAVEFILNFLDDEVDGDDVLFGDLGNDWIVGSTGRDHSYGGWGDDLINDDDLHETKGGLNDEPDTAENYEDIAFGGAGRDVLIANTGGDRLIDWAGEFNSFIVPFAPFGLGTISRALQPQIADYLYDLSASDGADPTRPARLGLSAEEARNGEPFGELGLVRQQDSAWQDQTGAPDDPQPGNVPGGQRDVLRSVGFNSGQADGFYIDSGVWSMERGSYMVEPEFKGGDALSVFLVDDYVPNYFEMRATLRPVKPISGYKSNAYVVFDYYSETDFKFAGINVSTSKLEIGHRTKDGWHVDVQTPYKGSLKSDTNYNILLSVNGVEVTLVVDNKSSLSHAFEPRVDKYGITHGINEGMVGLGGDNSKAAIDNVIVQRLAPEVTYMAKDTFDTVLSELFTVPESGNWLVAGGRFAGYSSDDVALHLVGMKVDTNSLIELSGAFNTTNEGGFVFDYYKKDLYKFISVNSQTGEISIGHRIGHEFHSEMVYKNALIKNPGDKHVEVVLEGRTVSVKLDNQLIMKHAYNAVVTDGGNGIFSKSGHTSFNEFTAQTNDPVYENSVDPLPLGVGVPTPVQLVGQHSAPGSETIAAEPTLSLATAEPSFTYMIAARTISAEEATTEKLAASGPLLAGYTPQFYFADSILSTSLPEANGPELIDLSSLDEDDDAASLKYLY
jgi:Ca2+-binding RTX toxin-like protein